jgi:hypothetical protein
MMSSPKFKDIKMTTTTTATKTASSALLALTQQATAAVTVGSAVDVSTKFAIRIFVKMGRTVATALTNEVGFRFEASPATSGNDEWVPVFQWTSATGKTAANSTTLNGATSANASTYIVTSATGITTGDYLYLRETGTPANSEWSRVGTISSATVTPTDNLTRAHTNSIAITDLGEFFTFDFDVSTMERVRLVVDSASGNQGTTAASGQTVDVLAWYVSLDSVLGT